MARKDRDDDASPAPASRRDFLKVSASVAAAAAAAPLISGAAAAQGAAKRDDGAALDRATRGSSDPKHRILLKGGTIVSMDPKIGDLVTGDILIEGKKIVAIGPKLTATAEVIDASNTILIPGFVDAHRHAWEGQLRRINPNAGTLDAYSAATHRSFALHYRPHDMYVGNFITAMGCIDAGITCFIDNSHNSRSTAHSDEAIRALVDSGIRAVHASGPPLVGEWDKQWPQDLERLKTQHFTSDDQLVTLRMFAGPNRELWAIARRLGLRITTEFQGPQMAKLIEPFFAENLVGPDNTFNHCGGLPDETWEHLRDAGVTVDVCPRSDSQYGLGEGFPPYQKALDHGIKPGFSVDNETSYSGDMFMEMRVAFHIQRALITNRRFNVDTNVPPMVSTRDVLACATVNGAACAGLSDKIGTLTPGKEADIVMIRTDAINLYPSNNAIGTVVAADRGNIDTVIIGGRIRKSRGQVVGLDMTKFRKMVDESRSYLFEKAGYKPDIFAEQFKI
ncbi:MAG: amidohydrolase [Rhodospirillales bacterium]|jgi:5-methylthioadenosine/S-adenosylhomocysteine deaminase|nr:amidohydrolase [Rhodospirillales bacterium]